MVAPEPSYAVGPSDIPLIEKSIGGYLQDVAARHAKEEALVSKHQGARYRYSDLCRAVERAARGFMALGVEPGDRVAIWSTNRAEWIMTQYAAATIGAIVVAINPALRAVEVAGILADTAARMLIVGPGPVDTNSAAILRSLTDAAGEARLDGIDGGRRAPCIVWLGSTKNGVGLTWGDMIARSVEVPSRRMTDCQNAVRPDAPAMILYTSGTTGRPRGATLSHRALINCGWLVGQRMQYNASDRICVPVPLCHVFGCVLGTMGALSHGSALVLPSDRFHPRDCLRTVEDERCTAVYGVPTTFIAQLQEASLRRYDLGSLRTGIIAGAVPPVDLIPQAIERLHISELTVSFGMTETLATLHTAIGDSPARRAATVGTALPHVECSITEPATRVVVPRGTRGELRTRGYGVMLGYWKNPAATAEAIDSDGWVRTGDSAVMADDGYVTIVGRLKDIIIRAGEKIWPGEVEELIAKHPKVHEVHVIGVDDPEYGEDVCAWIRVRDGQRATAEEIRHYCRGRIATFKIPKWIRFVDDFPRTASGKVQKYRMREMYAATRAGGLA